MKIKQRENLTDEYFYKRKFPDLRYIGMHEWQYLNFMLPPRLLPQCSLLQFIGRIGDMFWVEQVASTMVSHMLAVCPTPFERTHLLRLLAEANFGDGYKCNGEGGREGWWEGGKKEGSID